MSRNPNRKVKIHISNQKLGETVIQHAQRTINSTKTEMKDLTY